MLLNNKRIKILHIKESFSGYGADEQIRVLVTFLDKKYENYRASPRPLNNDRLLAYHKFYEINFCSSFDFKSIWALAKLLREQNFDFIHGHSSRSDWIGFWGWIFSMRFNTKLVTTIHAENDVFIEYKKNSFKTKLVFLLRPIMLKIFFPRVFTVSDAIRSNMIKKMGFNKKHIIHVNNGNDLKKVININKTFNMRKEICIKKKYIVMTSARIRTPLGESKGYLDLIEMVKTLNVKRNDYEFIALGDGDDYKKLQNLIKNNNITNIQLIGHKNNSLDYINNADVFMLVSHKNVEGTPRALMEAMALGKACIGTNVGGISEIIEHNVTGLLVNEKEPMLLATTLNMLLDDSEKRLRLGKMAKDKIFNRYSGEIMAREYDKIYSEVLLG